MLQSRLASATCHTTHRSLRTLSPTQAISRASKLVAFARLPVNSAASVASSRSTRTVSFNQPHFPSPTMSFTTSSRSRSVSPSSLHEEAKATVEHLLDHNRPPTPKLIVHTHPQPEELLQEPFFEHEPVHGIIFDMDGTLTLPGLINFKHLRALCGLKPGDDLIHALERDERCRLLIETEEKKAIERCQIQQGYHQLFTFLHQSNIRTAIVTRNGPQAVEAFLDKTNTSFSIILDRTFHGGFKPSPAPLQHILNQWQMSNKHVLMVGDALDDLLSAKNAEVRSVLIENRGVGIDDKDKLKVLRSHAHHSIQTLDELIEIVDTLNRNSKHS